MSNENARTDIEPHYLPYLPCTVCGHPSQEQFHINLVGMTYRFHCQACGFDMLAGDDGYPTADHRVEFINRLGITLYTLNQYVYDESHGDVLTGEPVGEVMKSLEEVLQRQLER